MSRADGAAGMARMFSLGREFPGCWHRLFHGTQEVVLQLGRELFPFVYARAKQIVFTRVEVFVKMESAALVHEVSINA